MDIFKETSAEEVIFVLPRKSKAFTHEEHFIILASEAAKTGKKISLLCSNPDVNKLARKYKFDVLMPKGQERVFIAPITEHREEAAEIGEEAVEEEPAEEVEEEVPVAIVKPRGGFEGIVRHQSGHQLNIASKKEKEVKLDVQKKAPHRHVEEIQNVWEALPDREEKSIWADLGLRQKKAPHPRREFNFPIFRNLSRSSVIALGTISLLLLGTIIYVSTGSAKIDIRPQKQELETELKVSASDKYSLIDQNLNKLPGQLFSIDKTVNQTFPATGEKEVAQKARGKLTVYNAYGTTPQVLIATTRFEKDGLIFRTLKTITVPGTKVANGEITPGSVNVEVVADKAGESYNISAGKFTITAFKEKGDTGRYEKIYAESSEPMKGGLSGRAKVVTESDYNGAKEALQDQLRKEIEDGLKHQIAGLKTIENLSIKFGAPESSAQIDEAAESFTMSIQGSLKTIGFKEEDLFGLIKQHVDETRGMTVLPEQLELNYKSINFKTAENILEFTVGVSGSAYAKVDIGKIKSELAGKNENAIKAYLRGIQGIESAKVVLSPFWVKRIPEKSEKTLINISY